MKYICILMLAAITIGLTGCSKGTILKDESAIQMRVFALTSDELRFNVYINEASPQRIDNEHYFNTYAYLSPERTYHIRVEQLPAGNLIVDTVLAPVLGTAVMYPVTVYQSAAGEQPKLLLPDAGEPMPAHGTGKFLIGYRDAFFPDKLIFRFFTDATAVATDSCIVSRGQFSTRWVTLPFGYAVQYEVLNGATRQVISTRAQFMPASTGEEQSMSNGRLSLLYYDNNTMISNPFRKFY